jgi:polysaccharide export outer membrane protein
MSKKSCTFARYLNHIMQKTIKILGILALVAMVTSSCVTQKKMTYLREINETSADSINKYFQPSAEITIKPGDALTIFVTGLDHEAVAPYNLSTVTVNDITSTQVRTTPMLLTYRVDEAGDIEMPVLGKIHIEGLVRAEAEELIKSRLESQVLNPMVQVNLTNARVSILGEVARPGTVNISQGRLTLLEALAAVGDLTPYGRRDNVLISREVEGKMEFCRLDLTKDDVYKSPYYYLQQNDVVYVSPNKVRSVSSSNVGLWLSTVSTLASAATVIVTVLRYSEDRKK